MAEYLLRNSLNPNKVISCTITLRKLVNKNEEGEPVWLLQIGTVEPHKYGGKIPSVFVHYTSKDNLDAVIKEATEFIGSQVNWEPCISDLRPPFVDYCSIRNGSISESIYSNVYIDIKDILPAAGIDHNSIKFYVNDVDVSNEVELDGDPYRYRIKWFPKIRVLDYF
jgi:hypothetical protein